MARFPLVVDVVDRGGNSQAGATVEVRNSDDQTAVRGYVAASGGTQVASPLLTDNDGQAVVWLDEDLPYEYRSVVGAHAADWVPVVQGPRGPAGVAGATGSTGPKGDKGDTGNTGANGTPGAAGATGATGPKGDKGDTGNTGPKGDTGDMGPAGTVEDVVWVDLVPYLGPAYASYAASHPGEGWQTPQVAIIGPFLVFRGILEVVGGGIGTMPLMTLPAEFRPPANRGVSMPCVGGAFTGYVFPSGRVEGFGSGPNTFVVLDQVVTLADTGALVAPAGTMALIPLSRSGELAVTSGSARFPVPSACAIHAVTVAAGTAPTGADLVVDVNRNGTTIFTTQANRPRVVAGSHEGSNATPDVTTLAAGDYLTVDVDQVGSSVPGSDLTVTVWLVVA